MLALAQGALARDPHPSKVELTFNHFYTYAELEKAVKDLAAAYPELLRLESIGKSHEGRDMWLMTLNNAKTGEDRAKPAMWIDANVHGNEVQGSETVLYTIWTLTKSYGGVEKLTKLMDEKAFYFLPMVNPDGREHWFQKPNTSSSSRSGTRPTDEDHDGLYDEDGYDDLDGDGAITFMWKKDPRGNWRRSNKDPRIFERVERDEHGDYVMLGSEGIDNDGDGQVNEDDPGGYDMNRNWPSDWQPEYIQFGSGDYPFSYSETACIGRFLLDHPNVAAVQSYHNAGGMILRGPGVQYREDAFPREDMAVYEEIGKTGELMLPHYKYMIIWKDLYRVHGGFVNWTSEGLGIFSFTNELWSAAQYFNEKDEPGFGGNREKRMKFADLLEFGDLYRPLEPFKHPTYGDIEIGGFTQYASRVPPRFMLEELCHRNAAFTLYHAEQMPRLGFGEVEVKDLGGGLRSVTVQITNDGAVPTISARAAAKQIGARDFAELVPATGSVVKVAASGTLEDKYLAPLALSRIRPERVWYEKGIPGHGERLYRWIVSGSGKAEVSYVSEKGGTIRRTVEVGR